MTAFIKKQSVAFWFNCIAAIAGVVGLIAMNVSSNIDTAYAYHGLTSLVLLGICGIVLAIVAIVTPNIFGNHDFISTAAVIGSVALYASLIGKIINQRILLVAGLFSYNSQNMVGWSVFYATVTAIVALVIAILALIIGAFTPSVKNN